MTLSSPQHACSTPKYDLGKRIALFPHDLMLQCRDENCEKNPCGVVKTNSLERDAFHRCTEAPVRDWLHQKPFAEEQIRIPEELTT
jgi:hypothetical protein